MPSYNKALTKVHRNKTDMQIDVCSAMESPIRLYHTDTSAIQIKLKHFLLFYHS